MLFLSYTSRILISCSLIATSVAVPVKANAQMRSYERDRPSNASLQRRPIRQRPISSHTRIRQPQMIPPNEALRAPQETMAILPPPQTTPQIMPFAEQKPSGDIVEVAPAPAVLAVKPVDVSRTQMVKPYSNASAPHLRKTIAGNEFYDTKRPDVSALTQRSETIQAAPSPLAAQNIIQKPAPQPYSSPTPYNNTQSSMQKKDSTLSVAEQRGWKEYIPSHETDTITQPSFRAKTFAGYRVDEIDFTIAGTIAGTSPNVLSELEWEALQMYQIGATAEYTQRGGMVDGFHGEISGSVAEIYSGDVQDSDFSGDDRTNEFSRSNNSAEEGNATDVKFALGYEMGTDNLAGGNISQYSWITPMLGYQYNELNVVLQDGFQSIPATGPFPGLDSEYETQWDGPFLALKGGTTYGAHRLELRGEYHMANFEGIGRWNLRGDLAQPVSFIQTGDAHGLQLQADYSYAILDDLSLYANAAYLSWSVEDGNISTLLSNGITLATRLNEVNWDSQAYNVGVAYSF